MTSIEDPQIISRMINSKAIDALIYMLKNFSGSNKIILVVLEALDHLLKVGKAHFSTQQNSNIVVDYIEKLNGIDTIEELQNHHNEKIYEKAIALLENYFTTEEI